MTKDVTIVLHIEAPAGVKVKLRTSGKPKPPCECGAPSEVMGKCKRCYSRAYQAMQRKQNIQRRDAVREAVRRINDEESVFPNCPQVQQPHKEDENDIKGKLSHCCKQPVRIGLRHANGCHWCTGCGRPCFSHRPRQ